MNIDEQFESFLADLGVEMEQPEDRSHGFGGAPEVSIFQASRDHYGVFYRLDVIGHRPELRVMVPTDKGVVMMDTYLVRLSALSPLNAGFTKMTTYEGSVAYEQAREATLQHLLYAVAEMMKMLFWAGDIDRMSFPAEIEVYSLSLQEDKKLHKGRGERF